MAGYIFWIFVGIIFYIYAGYPIILTLLAKIRTENQRDLTSNPFVTLLITAYNEETVIAQKIENSLKLDYDKSRLQILVAADGSDDRTVEIVKQYQDQGVEISFSPPRRGKMAAINRALSRVQGEIIIFSDANNLFAANVVKELLAPFANPKVGIVSGSKSIYRGDGVLGESEGFYWKYESFIKTQETRLGCCTSVLGEVMAVRNSLIKPCPERIINDDFYLALMLIRKGYNSVYAPGACSFERISLSARDEFVRRTRIIAGRYQAMMVFINKIPLSRPVVIWQMISHKFMRPLVPFAMIGALIANIIAVIWPIQSADFSLIYLSTPFNWLMLVLQGIFYGLAVFGNHIDHKHIVGRLLYLPTFLVISNIAAISGLYCFLTGRQTPLWQRAQRREIVDHSSNAEPDKL